ncbi:MAG: transketolase [Polaribacter sp.]|jgi:hypothetical protein
MKKISVVLIFGILLFNNGLYACSCVGKSTVAEGIKYTDAVITGKIISKDLITLIDPNTIIISTADSTFSEGISHEITIAKYRMIMIAKFKGKNVKGYS